MKVVLNELKKEFIFFFEEVNIEKDPELFEKYKEKIPVLIYKGRMIGKYRIDKKKFIKFLLQ